MTVRITASDFHARYRPSDCQLRVYLRSRGEKEAEPGPYEEVIRSLGVTHERAHLATIRDVVDLSEGDETHRIVETLQHITRRTRAIYQAALSVDLVIADTPCVLRGDPDLLILEEDGYIIRDCKISRRVTERDHPEILRQLEFYGWLYEHTTGQVPKRLEVFNGPGEYAVVDYDGGARMMQELRSLVELKTGAIAPFEPVGWTKCGHCAYRDLCWKEAESQQDVALLMGVDQNLVRALRGQQVRSIQQLRASFDESELAAFRKPRGTTMVRIGKAAGTILRSAESMAENREIVIGSAEPPRDANCVMFDLEGLPPQLDELDKIFLWGVQVFGERPSEYRGALAGFGPAGDRVGWERFLALAEDIFAEHGDLPFVHWHHYERTKVGTYVTRFGDRDGIAARVEEHLVDLLPIMQNAIVLPVSSYSLKVVERFVGFERTLPEGRGDWAMAKYIEASETSDESVRSQLMDEVFAYNREDLEATWAVLEWMRRRFPGS